MITGTGTGDIIIIIEEDMEGRRVARARLGRVGLLLVQGEGGGGEKENGKGTGDGSREEGLMGKSGERRL